jgi:hypothetical protein
MRQALAVLACAVASLVGVAHAANPPRPAASAHKPAPSASAASSAAPSASAAVPETVGGCVESFPAGSARPTLEDKFPAHGVSGYAAILNITIEHGKGESVLPQGLELQGQSEAARQLKAAGFVIPDQSGGGVARLQTTPDPKRPDIVKTTLDFPLLVLPPKGGRHTLVLPPLPVALARANGDVSTACTHSHVIVVEDATASTPDAMPHPNPPPRPQREEWTSLKKALIYGAAGLAAGLILAYLIRKWLARPRPVPPPPPPRPPWEIALERLDEVRHAGLLEVTRFQEYFDRVNDAVRDYLGARYGFDGLESTTDEILNALKRASIEEIALPFVLGFCEECDLVKFANETPTLESCKRVLDAAERIVRSTMPRSRPSSAGEPPQTGSPFTTSASSRGPRPREDQP